ncbi:MAG: site-specific DNA-methyltransferase [Bacteroidales bacterium]|nr:site-specific DNA-methyltransferase [Bacteroidales bacterium]
MEKLHMQTHNIVDENIKKIAELFPNCLTERLDENGKPEVAIDFDQLRQELSKDIVEGPEERYQFTWPDKRNAIRLANAPTTDTLRPCREESVDFDNTQNLYIEGDNLEVLKLLRENYLGKVKMIYIDPPYNTGNDFVYNDDFTQTAGSYIHNSGQEDEEGNRLVANTESNGRFHTDWLNMIYPRLKVAKDLLSEDGVIFISMDDNEVENLRKLSDEVFGEQNFQSCITWRRRTNQPNDKSRMIAKVAEYILVYAKNDQYLSNNKLFHGVPLSEKRRSEYTNPDNDPKGAWSTNPWKAAVGRGGTTYEITTPTGVTFLETWYGTKETFENCIKENRVHWTDNGNGFPRMKIYLKDAEKEGQAAINFLNCDQYGSNQEGSSEMDELFVKKGIFDNPKPTRLIKAFAHIASDNDSLILDFFSGSATTAHAVMQLNAEDGGNRKFIMVQLPEATDEESEAYKAGYKNICEIGKERIRRAGKKIVEEQNAKQADLFSDEKKPLDIGFRVLKLDSSNMQDVYYSPEQFNENLLFEDNIKHDRTDEDLLFQAMIELGIELSAKIEQREIAGKTVWSVADNYLMACFDKDVNETAITEIARQHPYYFVLRDSSLATDNVADNFEQIWEEYSKETIRRII